MTLKRLLMAASATALLSSPLLASPALAQAPGSAPPNSKPPVSPSNPPPSSPSAQAPAPATPPAPPAAAPAAAATPAASGDIVATLQAKGGFSTFLKAVDAAGLTETLKSTDVLAVFAPTDAAFAALPPGTVDAWLKPENKDKLRQTLLYHTIHAQVTSAQILNRKGAVKSGADVDITLDGGGGKLKVDDANIVEADIKASNGTIFAIDKVLTPGAAPAAAAAPTGAMAANGSARFNPAYVVRAGWQDTAKPGSQSDPKDDAPPKDPKKPPTDPVMNPPADSAPPATTDDAPPADDATPATEDKATPPAATPAAPADPATPPTETTPAQPADPATPAMPADMTHKKAGDPGVVSNTPVPNPPEKGKAKPHA